MGILSQLVLAPVLTAIIILCTPAVYAKFIKVVSLLGSCVTLVLSLVVLGNFHGGDFHFQMMEKVPWIPSLGINYLLGVDGISIWMIVLTALLGVVAVGVSWYEHRNVKAYMALLLILQASLLGTFVALDMILFYTFFEISLFPMVFLIWMWGDENRNVAAIRFFIYLFGGSIFMLVGMVVMAHLNEAATGSLSFSIIDIQSNVANGTLWASSMGLQPILFWAFAIAFLIKSPAFPFHTWLVDSYTQAPIGAVLLGSVIKTGTYGLVRFCLPLFPEMIPKAAPIIVVLAVIGILYGGLAAVVQRDMKRLIAFSSVAHVGFLLLGIFSMSYEGLLGGVLGGWNHGIATGCLLTLVGFLLWRYRTKDLEDFGGLRSQMPTFATLFLIATLASLGLPGTNAFVSEFLALFGSFKGAFTSAATFGVALPILAAAGVILAAIYMLVYFMKLFYGPIRNPDIKRLKDLKHREVVLVGALALLIIWGGVEPNVFIRPISASADATEKMWSMPANQRPSWDSIPVAQSGVTRNEVSMAQASVGGRS